MHYLFHHNDDDGISAGNLLKEFLIEYRDVSNIEIMMKSISYSDILNEFKYTLESDHVYIVDYSFSNKENVKMFKEMLARGVNVVWIDHHATSKDLVAEINNCHYDNCQIIFDISRCGAYLTYKHIMGNLFNEEKVPLFIQYIDDYDRFKFALNDTLKFHYGMMAYDYKNNDSYFSEIMDFGVSIFNIKKFDYSEDFVYKMIREGQMVERVMKCTNEKFCNDFGFESTIKLRGKKYKCFVGNKKEGSKAFRSVENRYDMVIGMVFNGTDFEYSFYSKNRTEDEFKKFIECLRSNYKVKSAGGHPNAFGAVTRVPILFKDKKLILRRNYAKFLWSRIYRIFQKTNSRFKSSSR